MTKLKTSPFRVAAEALEELMIGVDGKRRRFFVMERAEAGVAVAETAQARHVIGDHADDIDCALIC